MIETDRGECKSGEKEREFKQRESDRERQRQRYRDRERLTVRQTADRERERDRQRVRQRESELMEILKVMYVSSGSPAELETELDEKPHSFHFNIFSNLTEVPRFFLDFLGTPIHFQKD